MSEPAGAGDPYFQRLRARRRAAADGRLATYRRRLAVLHDVVVDVTRVETASPPRFGPGFLHLPGARLPRLRWRRPRLRRPALRALLATLDGPAPPGPPAAEPRPHVLVLRHEPGDLFRALGDCYNVFLTRRFLGAADARVVLADGHPDTPLDALWPALFGDVARLHTLGPGLRRLATLALAPVGYDGPLLAWRARALPLAAEFRRFVLDAHAVPDSARPPGPLRVTLVRPPDDPGWIAGETAVLQALRGLADVEARAVALDRLPFREQLAVINATDVLVGSPGPALTHALFLPPWAGLVELLTDPDAPRARHFRRIAEWRGLFYTRWQSRERIARASAVPPAAVVDALRRYAYRPGSRL